MATGHCYVRRCRLRFDISLLATRVIALTDWVARYDESPRLRVGLFGASTGARRVIEPSAYTSGVCRHLWNDVELDAVHERVVVDRPRVRGAPTKQFAILFTRSTHVCRRHAGERNHLYRIDLD